MSSTAQFSAESDTEGRFVRQESRFRDRVTADGSSGFPAVAGRYHLYVSLACPWAHRAVIVREIKGLQDAIGLTVVDPLRDELGWRFREGAGSAANPAQADPLHGWDYLSRAYLASDPTFTGRVSVPVLWDKETGRIVNNESADIIEDLNREFDAVAAHPEVDLAPAGIAEEMAALNDRIYEFVNNGVYRAGFASSQTAYEEAVVPLFEVLDELEERLTERRYLLGDRPTLADWRLFTTLVRFDPVYVGHFKCNIRRIADHPALSGYLRDLYQQPGIAETVDLEHIKSHYYGTHASLNPSGIVPVGPELDLDAPHGRA
jgi:glutathionyl-hydroquinone reductase